MHGSLDRCKEHAAAGANVHAVEASSSRTALHKAAFWGHEGIVAYLLDECKVDANATDSNGDGALNDAVRFGHAGCASRCWFPRFISYISQSDGEALRDISISICVNFNQKLAGMLEKTNARFAVQPSAISHRDEACDEFIVIFFHPVISGTVTDYQQ
jgi:hypothetical protein